MDTYRSFVRRTVQKNLATYLLDIFSTAMYIFFFQLLSFISKIMIDQLEGNPPTMFIDQALTNLLGGYDFLHSHLYLLPIITMILAVLTAGFNYLCNRLAGKMQAEMGFDDQTWLFSELEHSNYPSLKKLSNGDTLQTVTRDETVARRFLFRDIISSIFYSVFFVISSFLMLYFLNPIIAWFSTLVLPVLFAYYLIGIPTVRKRYRILDESEAKMTEKIEENIKSARLVKAYGNQEVEMEEFEILLKDYEKKNYRLLAFNSLFFCGGDLIVALQTVLTLITSIVLIVQGSFSVGSLVVATSFSASLIYPVKRVGRSFSNYSQASVSYRRIAKLMSLPKENHQANLKPDLNRDIIFKDLTFKYDDGVEPVLKNIDLTIKAGSTLAIMGKTGSGKTTLINLLSRLYEPTSGHIYIGEHDISDIEIGYLRDNVGVVLQESFLFSRSVLSNIKIKNEDLCEEELEKISHIAALDSTIEELPQGYDTFVGEKGVSLSGGQKQRISIARTLAQNTPILIFDDSLSAVDTSTDIAIRRELKLHKKETTTIIITHRISTAKDADKIIVLDDGKIIEEGTDKELLAKKGLYAHINSIQGRQNSKEEE